ncbi:MAG TPA: hypothetical protein VF510_17730, partial [Ktedonobacterales bacterium]
MAEGKIGWPGLLAALEQGDEQVARTARRWRRFIALAMFILCLLTVACIGWVLIELRDAWDTGRWWYFWQTVIGPFLMVTYGAPVLSVGDPFTRYADAARKIREAAIRGDEQDAPVAQENSQLYPDSNALFGGISYGPLKRPNDARGAVLVALLFVAVLIAITLGVVMLAVGVSGAGEVTTQQEEIVGGIILLLLLFSIGSLVVFLRMRRDIVVVADDIGITWKREGWRTQSRSIAWTDVRAFFVITRQSSTHSAKETTWVLMGSSGTLTWRDPQESTSQADTPHAQFAALVAARTRLPLRDLSALANRVTSTQFTTERREAILAALNAAATRQEQREVLRSSIRKNEPATKPTTLGLGCTVQLVLVIVFAVLYAGGWGLKQYQPHYYEGMLVQIHASKPLYHDGLTYDDDKWDMEFMMPIPTGHSFKEDGFHLTTTKGYATHSWTTFEHGDAAVEVTTRQIGTTDSDGVGLALRANENGSDMVVFYVDSAGYWQLLNYHFVDSNPSHNHNWSFLDGGHSKAIHTGNGAVNQLLVLMRRDQYVCYINGHMVEVY